MSTRRSSKSRASGEAVYLGLLDEVGDGCVQDLGPEVHRHSQRHGGDSWRQVIHQEPVQACMTYDAPGCHLQRVHSAPQQQGYIRVAIPCTSKVLAVNRIVPSILPAWHL